MSDESKEQPITSRELREAELQMTGQRPSAATGIIGFVPDVPPGYAPPDGATPAPTPPAAPSSDGTDSSD
jgi:hypothetical protein